MLFLNGAPPLPSTQPSHRSQGFWWILIMLLILAGFGVEIWLGARQLSYWLRHPLPPPYLNTQEYAEVQRLGRKEIQQGFILTFLRYAPLTAFFGLSGYAAGWRWCEQKLVEKYADHPHRRVKIAGVYFALIVALWYGVEGMATLMAFFATNVEAMAAELVTLFIPLLVAALSYLSIIPLFSYISKKMPSPNQDQVDRRTLIYVALQAYYVLLLVGFDVAWAAWWRWLPRWARFSLETDFLLQLKGLLDMVNFPMDAVTAVNLPMMQQVWSVGFASLSSIVIMRGAVLALTPSALMGLVAHALGCWSYGHGIIELTVMTLGVILLLQCLRLILHSKRIFHALGFPDHPPLLCALLLPFLLQHPIRTLLRPTWNFIGWWLCWQADEYASLLGYGRELMAALQALGKTSNPTMHGDWLVALFTSRNPIIGSRMQLLRDMGKRLHN